MKHFKYYQLLLIFCVTFQVNYAQNSFTDVDIISAYEDYAELDREVVYTHINKSTFIKGESIGLKSYVFDKNTKQFSKETTNLYVAILDDKGKTISSKMVMVNYGAAFSDFEIDDKFTSGTYEIKVYTNWMKNFEEQNLFTANIRIIDPVLENLAKADSVSDTFDVQFLSEGGHILAGADNTIGVVIKNEKGLGVPLVEGEVFDSNNQPVTTFKVNPFGIGKFTLKPEAGQTYKAKLKFRNTSQEVAINPIETNGLTMSLSNLKDMVALRFRTNNATLPTIENTVYKMVIHNGSFVKESFFNFKSELEVVQAISHDDLFSGINIFTVFDGNNNPILERLFFNYNGFEFKSSESPVVTTTNDSITVSLPYVNVNVEDVNHFSVSVLPEKTITYAHHHNLASYLLLQPYVKGYIEQASYYFTEVTDKKKYDLDNLLLTQGWSSFDWQNIFNNPPDYDYDFENGISFTINSKGTTDKQLLIYPSLNNKSEIVSLNKENSSFIRSEMFPIESETIVIGELTATGKVVKPNLYLQFDPLEVPRIETKIKGLEIRDFNTNTNTNSMEMTSALGWKKVEQLDEVVLTKKKDYTEIEKLNDRSIGNVAFMDETLIKRYRTIDRYLNDKGFNVSFGTGSSGDFTIRNNIVNSVRPLFTENTALSGQYLAPEIGQNASTIPIVYLDGVILHNNLNILKNISLNDIEYIEINKTGVGGGMRAGGAGLIRIKTRPSSAISVEHKQAMYASYEVPLKFSVAKKFYVPEYSSYTSDFFNEFGVVNWLPNLHLDEKGHVDFKIATQGLSKIKLFIEGALNDGTFISETKIITID